MRTLTGGRRNLAAPAVKVDETLVLVDLGDRQRGTGQQDYAEGGYERSRP